VPRIGNIEWGTSVDPSGADRGTAEVEARVKAALDAISRSEATATIRADLRELDVGIADAQAKLKRLSADKADPSVELDDETFKAEYDATMIRLKRLQAQRVEIGVRYRQSGQVNKELETTARNLAMVQRLEAERARAEQAASAAAVKGANDARLSTLKNRVEVDRLRASYGKQRAELASLAETQAKTGNITETDRQRMVSLSHSIAYTGERIRQLGGDTEGAVGEFRRLDAESKKSGSSLGNLGRKITSARVNIGPLTLTLRSLALVAASTAPILTDLAGAAVALVGSLGSALVGAAAAGAGALSGFALTAGGVAMAVHPITTQLKDASAATVAYNKAVQTYGKNSTEAKTASKNLQMTLKGMSTSLRAVHSDWTKLQQGFMQRTGGIRQSFISDLHAGLKSASALMPTFARGATSAFSAVSKGWDQWMQGLRSPEAKNLLQQVLQGFTQAVPSLMHGIGQFATGLARVMAVGSDFFKSFTQGFDRTGTAFANATSNSGKLHSTIGGLVSQTHSWFALLGATGRLLTTVFAGGAKSGQGMVDDLTGALNRYNRALQTAQGQLQMKQFFADSAQTAEQLVGMLKRVLVIFFDLSRAFQPFAAGFLDFLNALGDVGHAVAQVKALRPAFVALGLALGAAFAVHKIKDFMGWISDARSTVVTAVRSIAIKLGLIDAANTTVTESSAAAAEAQNAEAAASERAGFAAAAATPEIAAEAAAFDALAVSAGGAAGAEGLGAVAGAAGATEGALAGVEAAGADAAGAGGIGALAVAAAPFAAASGAIIIGAKLIGDSLDGSRTSAERLGGALKRLKMPQGSADLVGPQPYLQQARAAQQAAAGEKQLRQATKDRSDAQRGAKSAQDRYNQAVKEDGRFSQAAGRAAIVQINAEARLAKSHREVQNAVDRIHTSYNREVQGARNAAQASRIHLTALKQEGRLQEFNTQQLQRYGDTSHSAGAIVAANDRRLSQVLNERATALVNVQRQTAGVAQVSANAAQQVGAFARKFGQIPNVQKLLVKTNSPQALRQLSNVANQADRLGQKKSVVNVLAKTDNAQSAISQISNRIDNATRGVSRFVLGLTDNLSGPARHAINTVKDSIRQNFKAILTGDGSKATAEATKTKNFITGAVKGPFDAPLGINDKATGPAQQTRNNIKGLYSSAITQVIQSDGQAAISNAQSIKSALQAMFANPVIQLIKAVQGPGTKPGGGRAQGGAGATGARSQKVMAPGYMVGEEAPQHPEYIIATNPAYRDANTAYLSAAAADLGYSIVQGFAEGGRRAKGKPKPKPKPPPKPGLPLPDPGLVGSDYYQAENFLNYLDSLFGATQTKWQADIAARRVVIKDGVDPSGEAQGLIDNRRLAERKTDDLATMIQGMLLHDTKEVRGIGGFGSNKGRLAKEQRELHGLNVEVGKRNKHLTNVQGKISDAQSKLQTEKGKDKKHIDHGKIHHLEQELGNLRKEQRKLRGDGKESIGFVNKKITAEQALIAQLQTTLANSRSEYPALYDELIHGLPIRKAGYENDIQSILDILNPPPDDGGGGGGGGTTGPVPPEQLAYNTERYNLLRDFGGNAQFLAATIAGAATPAAAALPATALPTAAAPAAPGGSEPSVIGTPLIPSSPAPPPQGSYAPGGMVAPPPGTVGSRHATPSRHLGGGVPVHTGDVHHHKTTTVNNTYLKQPKDPHTWSRSLAHEVATL
jgi:hypothetical protein